LVPVKFDGHRRVGTYQLIRKHFYCRYHYWLLSYAFFREVCSFSLGGFSDEILENERKVAVEFCVKLGKSGSEILDMTNTAHEEVAMIFAI
jgi:hypothetical protein